MAVGRNETHGRQKLDVVAYNWHSNKLMHGQFLDLMGGYINAEFM